MSALTAIDRAGHHLGRRQRRGLRRRAHRVRPARLDERLQRRDRRRPGDHQRHPARQPREPVRRHPHPRAGRSRRGRGLPADLQRRGLQRRHLVLALRGGAAQPDRRPAQLAAGHRWPPGRASASPNPTSRSSGHAVCDDPEWINGLSWPIVESYHPNIDGQAQGYTPTVSPVLTGGDAATEPPTLRRRPAAVGGAGHPAARYAELDRTIEPKRFIKPDLTTKAAKLAARKAGINLERWLGPASPGGRGHTGERPAGDGSRQVVSALEDDPALAGVGVRGVRTAVRSTTDCATMVDGNAEAGQDGGQLGAAPPPDAGHVGDVAVDVVGEQLVLARASRSRLTERACPRGREVGGPGDLGPGGGLRGRRPGARRARRRGGSGRSTCAPRRTSPRARRSPPARAPPAGAAGATRSSSSSGSPSGRSRLPGAVARAARWKAS